MDDNRERKELNFDIEKYVPDAESGPVSTTKERIILKTHRTHAI